MSRLADLQALLQTALQQSPQDPDFVKDIKEAIKAELKSPTPGTPSGGSPAG